MDLYIRGDRHDLQIENGDIAADTSLYSTVILSLIVNARAAEDEVGPDDNRRGWWASELGSKLWLAERLKTLPDTEIRVENYISEALQWMTDTGVVASIDVSAERQGLDCIYTEIIIRRNDGVEERFVWNNLWDELSGAKHDLPVARSDVIQTNYILTQMGDFITTQAGDRLLWR